MAKAAKPIDNASSRELAPGELAHLQQFVNTVDPDPEIELWEEPADVKRWLVHHDLVAPSTRIGPDEFRRARELREAFRSMALANTHGGTTDAAAVEALDAAARRAELTLRWAGNGRVDLA